MKREGAGADPGDIAYCIQNEIESDIESELSADELGELIIEPYMTTQAEIDALPEFKGWM